MHGVPATNEVSRRHRRCVKRWKWLGFLMGTRLRQVEMSERRYDATVTQLAKAVSESNAITSSTRPVDHR